MDPTSQELQLRRAGVPLDHIHRDVGVSGTTGTQERRGWHRLNGRLAGGDTLVVVAIDRIDRIGRRWTDTIRSICELGGPGGEDQVAGQGGGPVDSLLGSRRRQSRGLLRSGPDHVRGLGCRPGTGVDEAPDSRGAGTGPTAGKGVGATQETPGKPGGNDAADAVWRSQPPADRLRLRLLGQHSPDRERPKHPEDTSTYLQAAMDTRSSRMREDLVIRRREDQDANVEPLSGVLRRPVIHPGA